MRRFLPAIAVLSVACSRGHSTVVATITPEVLVKDVVPFGLNVGSWTFWGAEQLMSNVLKNPGFEGLVDGAIVLPAHSGGGNFDESLAWLRRPDAFWEGARYSIRTGIHAGSDGRIAHSVATNRIGLPSFTVEGTGKVPGPAEVVALVRDRSDAMPTQWWFSNDSGNAFSPEIRQTRPGSPGARSLRISASSQNPAEVASYLDTIGDRAGKLLPLSGKWNLSFWARLDRGQAKLRVLMGREGSRVLVSQSLTPSARWTNFQMSFDGGSDSGPPGQISLRFQITGEPVGDLLLDDVDLHRDADRSFPFRKEVVATLKELHPSYLRDWQGQLGDTLANRVAPAFARKAWRYRPGDDAQTDFGYGLSDFLELSREVGASPWIIVPPVFTDQECADLGTWLATRGRVAPGREVLAEFGNENWNELFRPAGIPDPVLHGQAADRCLAAVRTNATGLNLKTVVNAQFANPAAVAAYGAESRSADIVAVAPYFGFSLPGGLTRARRNELLFESRDDSFTRVVADIRGLHKEPAVYEVNLHSIFGTATAAEREATVLGTVSGAALARTLLDALSHGVRRQCVYSLAGFDSALESVAGYAQLMGIVRDLGGASHFRPTGLALQLLNGVVGGDMKVVEVHGGSSIWVYAFELERKVSVVAVSGSEVSQTVSFRFPAGVNLGAGMKSLSMIQAASSSLSETSGHVSVREQFVPIRNGSTEIQIAPWSMVVLRPGDR